MDYNTVLEIENNLRNRLARLVEMSLLNKSMNSCNNTNASMDETQPWTREPRQQ